SGMMEFEWELEKPYIYMSAQKVSGYGKWISLVLQLNSFEDEGYYAGRYNVKTGEVERAGTFSNYTGDYYATGISNDGTAVGFMERESMQMYGRRAFIWRPDQKNVENLSKYCRGDESVSKLENGETLVYTGISGDSKRIAGFAMEEGIDDIEAFVISLGSSDSSISDIQSDQNYPEGIYDLSGRKLSTRPSSFPYVIIENGKAKKVIQFN
ncbi:MAG: hypothetical protein K2H76_06660, partial [Muribaculaceae bacterium]|nr:hypothetical protein [Muribaculaceae bacterium]